MVKVTKRLLQEGDVFAVTLDGGGYALGVVARSAPEGKVLLGYFFGPRLEAIPQEPPNLQPEQAAVVLRFGDLHLMDRKWPVISRVTPWQREQWTVPKFFREEPIMGKTWLVTYAGDNPAEEVGLEPCEREETKKYGRAVLSGAGSVELKLAKLLA